MSFENIVVIITGASAGIGAATAKVFAKEKAKLSIVGRNAERLKKTADECQQISGERPLEVVADISIKEDANNIIKKTVDYFGKIDVLVNNAAIATFKSLLSDDYLETFDNTFAINLRGTVMVTKAAAPYLIETRGNIVNVSSIASTSPTMAGSIYCATKAGLDQFGKCLALEFAPKGVRVNTINPGPVNTGIEVGGMTMTKDQMDKLKESSTKNIPLQRISEPEEVGELIVFLASDKARGITGALYPLDNGCLLKGLNTLMESFNLEMIS